MYDVEHKSRPVVTGWIPEREKGGLIQFLRKEEYMESFLPYKSEGGSVRKILP